MSVIDELRINLTADASDVQKKLTNLSQSLKSLDKLGKLNNLDLKSLDLHPNVVAVRQATAGFSAMNAASEQYISSLRAASLASTQSGLLVPATSMATVANSAAQATEQLFRMSGGMSALQYTLADTDILNYKLSNKNWIQLWFQGSGKLVYAMDAIKKSLFGILAPMRGLQAAVQDFLVPALKAAATALIGMKDSNPAAAKLGENLAKLAGQAQHLGTAGRTNFRLFMDDVGRLASSGLTRLDAALGRDISKLKEWRDTARSSGQVVPSALLFELALGKIAKAFTQASLKVGEFVKLSIVAAAGSAKYWAPAIAVWAMFPSAVAKATAVLAPVATYLGIAASEMSLLGMATSASTTALGLWASGVATFGVVPMTALAAAVVLNHKHIVRWTAALFRATAAAAKATAVSLLTGIFTTLGFAAVQAASALQKLGQALGSLVVGQLRKAATGFGQLKNAMMGASFGAMELVGPLAILGGVGSAVYGIFKGVKLGLDWANSAEQVRISLETMTGSAEKAKSVMDGIKKWGATTPFLIPGLNEAGKQLIAYGVAADQVVPTLRTLGDVAGPNQETFKELVEVYGKMKSMGGAVQLDQLNQIASRGVPIFEELTKVTGVQDAELRKMISGGKIGLGHVQKALNNLTSEGGKFHNGLTRQTDSVTGQWGRLKEALGLTFQAIAEGFLKAFNIKGAIGGLTGFINWIRGLAPTITQVFTVVGTVVRTAASWVMTAWAGIVPYLSGLFQTLSAVLIPIFTQIAAVSSAIYDAVAPVVGPIIATVAAGAGMNLIFGALLGVVGSVAAALIGFVGSFIGFWTVVGSAVAGALYYFGVFGTESKGVLGSVKDALLLAEFFFLNFHETVAYGMLEAAHQVLKFGNVVGHFFMAQLPYWIVVAANEVIHTFTVRIPTVLNWFFENWKDIFNDVWNFTKTVFTNIGKNIWDFIKSIPALIAGTKSFDDIWTPLTEGFERTARKLPEIARREITPFEEMMAKKANNRVAGPMEQLTKDAANDAKKQLDKKFVDFKKKREQETAVGEGELFGPPAPPPKVDPLKIDPAADPLAKDKKGKGGRGSSDTDNKALERGTIEAYSAEKRSKDLQVQKKIQKNTDDMKRLIAEQNALAKANQLQPARL
jgi:tape measure domain-containing protein